MIQRLLNLYIERSDFFLKLMWEHFLITLISVSLITLIGVVAGALMTKNKIAAAIILRLTSFLYTIPSIALFGILVSYTGIGLKSAIIAIVIYGILPMIRSTYTGLMEVDSEIIDAAVGMGSTQKQLLLKIRLPLAVPVIFSGFRTMVVMTIALGAIASFIGAGGLGDAIWRGISTNFPEMTLAGSLLVALFAITADLIMEQGEKGIRRKFLGERKIMNKSRKILSLTLAILLSFSALTSCSKEKKQIVLACKPMTEQYILAEILTQLIEDKTDIKVEQKLGIGGGTSNIHPGMEKGEIDIYPEYTGTGWLFVLKEDPIKDMNKLYDSVKKGYKEKYNIVWSGLYGLNNTYGLAVSKTLADEHNLKTFSDLAKISSELTFAANPDFFERDDGYNELSATYNFKFKNTKSIDIGLRYDALQGKEVDVISVFTTDAKLNDGNVFSLEDDLNYFNAYHGATLVRGETLKKYPELEAVLEKLTGKISNVEMVAMNYKVEIENEDPKTVATNFIKEKGLID